MADDDSDLDNDVDLVFTAGDDEEKPPMVGYVGGNTRVVVQSPFQVVHAEVVYRPGDEAVVPSHIAADWIRDGWVSPVK